MKQTILFLVLLLIVSCEKLNYDQLTNNQRQYLLYKSNEKVKFLKNKKDTIELKINSIKYTEEYTELTLKRISLTNSNLSGRIRIDSNEDYLISFKGRNFVYNDTNYNNEFKHMTNLNDLIFIGDTMINSTDYKNVYFICEEYDSLFFSLEKGIIQIKYKYSKEKFDLVE